MKNCTVFTHPKCLEHDTGDGHVEQIARLEYVLAALKKPEFSHLDWQAARQATVAELSRAHAPEYVDRILQAAPVSGYKMLDSDTVLCPQSVVAALHAAGAVLDAVDHVVAGKSKTAFCAVRPPGHHAETAESGGFCLFGNAALGAFHALAVHAMKRVAIVDFDVHHGNGTQDLVDGHSGIFFVSTHQSPLYPGTGAAAETGRVGNILNIPMAAGDGGAEFRKVFTDKILPALNHFKPELVIISAGFDAHRDDPLGGMNLTEADYAFATAELKKVADTHGKGRVVSVMEGGYNLTALAASVAAHVDVLAKDPAPKIQSAPKPPGV